LAKDQVGFIEYLKQNKKWWLIPIIACVLGLGALALLGEAADTPFTYTLF